MTLSGIRRSLKAMQLPPSSSVWWNLELLPSYSTAAESTEIERKGRGGKHN